MSKTKSSTKKNLDGSKTRNFNLGDFPYGTTQRHIPVLNFDFAGGSPLTDLDAAHQFITKMIRPPQHCVVSVLIQPTRGSHWDPDRPIREDASHRFRALHKSRGFWMVFVAERQDTWPKSAAYKTGVGDGLYRIYVSELYSPNLVHSILEDLRYVESTLRCQSDSQVARDFGLRENGPSDIPFRNVPLQIQWAKRQTGAYVPLLLTRSGLNGLRSEDNVSLVREAVEVSMHLPFMSYDDEVGAKRSIVASPIQITSKHRVLLPGALSLFEDIQGVLRSGTMKPGVGCPIRESDTLAFETFAAVLERRSLGFSDHVMTRAEWS